MSYDADLWGGIRRSIAQAKEQFQASAADLENVKLELQTELAADYFTVRGLDAQKQILDDTVVAYQKALMLTENRFNGGVASKAEVAQAQTQLNQTEAQMIDIGVERAQLEHAIAVLTGRVPEGFKLAMNPLKEAPPVIPVGVPSELLERRPDIARTERQVAAANEQVGIARTAFFPDLMIAATGGLESGSIVDWFSWPSRFWAVGSANGADDFRCRAAACAVTDGARQVTMRRWRTTGRLHSQRFRRWRIIFQRCAFWTARLANNMRRPPRRRIRSNWR